MEQPILLQRVRRALEGKTGQDWLEHSIPGGAVALVLLAAAGNSSALAQLGFGGRSTSRNALASGSNRGLAPAGQWTQPKILGVTKHQDIGRACSSPPSRHLPQSTRHRGNRARQLGMNCPKRPMRFPLLCQPKVLEQVRRGENVSDVERTERRIPGRGLVKPHRVDDLLDVLGGPAPESDSPFPVVEAG